MSQTFSKKSYTLSALSEGLGLIIQGDPNTEIHGVNTIQDAKPGQIAFLNNPVYKKYLESTEASAVILTEEDAKSCSTVAVIAADPYYTYAKIAKYFDYQKITIPGIHQSVILGQDTEIHPSVSIAPYCVIGDRVKIAAGVKIAAQCVIGDDCEIGEGTQLDARVTLYHRVELGKRVILASGVVLGSEGFGIAKHKGEWHKVPQLGRVVLGDEVEVGANTTIDRGAIDDTVIEKGVKLDNQIQIGHNVKIGAYTAIAGCVGIAGSTSIGQHCLIGGGSGFAGHISISDRVMITGMTAVSKSIREPGVYSSGVGGVITNIEWRKNTARLHRLDSLTQRIKSLESSLEALMEKEKS